MSRGGKQYDNTNRGILFVNDRREHDKHPHWRGSINVDGKEYWIDGWEKQTQKGDAISLSVKPKEPRQTQAGGGERYPARPGRAATSPRGAGAPSQQSFVDDDIPF